MPTCWDYPVNLRRCGGSCWHHHIHPTNPAHQTSRECKTSALGSVDLKIGMFRHTGVRCFSFLCLLLLHRPPGASLTMEYPSESAPPHSGEDGGEFPSPPTMGQTLGSLPCGLAVSDLADLLPPFSSVDPSLAAEGGALPTSCRAEPDSLKVRVGIASAGHSAHVQFLRCSNASTTWWQPPQEEEGWQQNDQSRVPV